MIQSTEYPQDFEAEASRFTVVRNRCQKNSCGVPFNSTAPAEECRSQRTRC